MFLSRKHLSFVILCFSFLMLSAQDVKIREWIALGNSFTIHDVTSFWWGNWGMAASRRDSDYCHVLQRKIADYQGKAPSFSVHNIINFETNHRNSKVISQVAQLISGTEDLIVIHVGECVSDFYNYQSHLEMLIDSLRHRNSTAQIVMTGTYWPHYIRNRDQEAACRSRGCIWVPMQQFYSSQNSSSLDTKVFGDDGEWHYIRDGGGTSKSVSYHANDRGHRLMGESIFDSLKTSWGIRVGISAVQVQPQIPERILYFDLNGRPVEPPLSSGIYIRRILFRNGKTETTKVMMR